MCSLWIVYYEIRNSESEALRRHRLTVIADSTDDAYAQARAELIESLDEKCIGLPISAEPARTAT